MGNESSFVDPARFSDYLVHYTTASTAFAHILPSGQLRMNRYSAVSDPLENQSFLLGSGGFGDLSADEHAQRDAVVSKELEAYRNAACMTCFCQARDPAGTRYGSQAQLSAAPWSRSRMWEQYAEGHAGVALVFDRAAIEARAEDDPNLVGGAVNYLPGGYSASDGASGIDVSGDTPASDVVFWRERALHHVEAFGDDFFFTKDVDFEGEAEYRIATKGRRGAADPLPFLDVRGALRAVILGSAFPAWQIPAAQAALAATGLQQVALRLMSWTLGQAVPGRIPESEMAEGTTT